MKKRGSHVGIILSFVVFILFVSFLFVVLRPSIKVQQNKELALEYLEKELVDLSKAKLTTVVISFNDLGAVSCVEIQHPEDFGAYQNAVVKKDGDLIGSLKSTDVIKFDILENQNFFKIYYSNETITGNSLVGEDCTEATKGENYTIGQISTKEYIFESKLLALFENATAQEDINKLINSEFDFGFTYFNGTEIWTNEIKDVSTNIYIKKIPVQYIDDQANIKSGYLNLRIW